MADVKKIRAEIASIKRQLNLDEDGQPKKADKKTLFLRNITGYNRRGVSGGETAEQQRLRRRLKELEQHLFDKHDGSF